jgi:hypothetical protein
MEFTIAVNGCEDDIKIFDELKSVDKISSQVETHLQENFNKVAENQSRKHNLAVARKRIEAGLVQDITDAQIDGKKAYPNAEARKAELSKRMDGTEIMENLAKCDDEMRELEAGIDEQKTSLKQQERRRRWLYEWIAYRRTIIGAATRA